MVARFCFVVVCGRPMVAPTSKHPYENEPKAPLFFISISYFGYDGFYVVMAEDLERFRSRLKIVNATLAVLVFKEGEVRVGRIVGGCALVHAGGLIILDLVGVHF